MTHRADRTFFAGKREWSRRKDEILRCYLAAYLPKVMQLGKPVLLVDGFAGPGKFGDGELGSPLIMCECVKQTLAKNLKSRVSVEVLCVEADAESRAELTHHLTEYGFASVLPGTFQDAANLVAARAAQQTVFLYVDPFTVAGLVWSQLNAVFRGLRAGNSVEILMNFNAFAFVRQGLAAIKQTQTQAPQEPDDVDAPVQSDATVEVLNAVVGGDWWQRMLGAGQSVPQMMEAVAARLCQQLQGPQGPFNEVCRHAVKAAPQHTTPKYYLVFASRHEDALRLMNDEMVKSRRALAELARPKEATLFETRSEELVPDLARLPDLIRAMTVKPIKRGDLIVQVVRSCFCEFPTKEIRQAIEQLLLAGELKSGTGKPRINDEVPVWKA